MRRGEFIVFLVVLVFLGSGIFVAAEAVVVPTSFTVTATSSCAIQLDWEDAINPADTTYDAQRKSTGGFLTVYTIPFQGSGGSYFFVDSHADSLWLEDMDPDSTYEYKIRATNPLTAPPQSDWVGPMSINTLSLPTQPGRPINVTSTVVDTNGNIEVSWATSTPISDLFDIYGGFEIWLATSPDGSTYTTPSKIGRIPGNPATVVSGKFVSVSASNDKDWSYQYKLRTQEVGGFGCDYTRPEHVVLSSDSDVLTIPRRPGSFDAQFVSDQGKITLTWYDNQSDPNETGFEIHKAADPNFISYQVLSAGVDSTEYNDTDIIQAPPTTYYYRIRSCIGGTCSFWSDSTMVTTGLAVIADFNARISYAATEEAATTLTWIPEEEVIVGSELRIERATSSLEFQEIAQLNTGDPRRFEGIYINEQLPLGETYVYRARVCDAGGGCSDYSPNEPSVNLDLLYILKGVAWAATTSTISDDSSGVGWIKFNSAAELGSTPSLVPYSVQIDKDGLVTGNAWADVIAGSRASYGWLSFHPEDLVGCENLDLTVNEPCEARFDQATGFNGWAKFLAPESFATDESSWDGWVSLSGTVVAGASLDSPFITLASLLDTSPFIKKPFSLFASLFDFTTVYAQTEYGVGMGTCVGKECPLTGVAWGSEVVGWIGFNESLPDGTTCTNCTARAEVINEPPTASNAEITLEPVDGWCASNPFYRVKWAYSDPDNDPLSSAEIAFVDNLSQTATSVVALATELTNWGGGVYSYNLFNPLGYDAGNGTYSLSDYLSVSTPYTAQVTTFDGFDWSNPAVSGSTTTPSHYGPYVEYVWNPDPPSVSNFATTTDASVDRSGNGLSNWLWEFERATPSSQTGQSAHVFIASSTVDVALTVTDALGSSCILTETKDVEGTEAPIKRRIFREK